MKRFELNSVELKRYADGTKGLVFDIKNNFNNTYLNEVELVNKVNREKVLFKNTVVLAEKDLVFLVPIVPIDKSTAKKISKDYLITNWEVIGDAYDTSFNTGGLVNGLYTEGELYNTKGLNQNPISNDTTILGKGLNQNNNAPRKATVLRSKNPKYQYNRLFKAEDSVLDDNGFEYVSREAVERVLNLLERDEIKSKELVKSLLDDMIKFNKEMEKVAGALNINLE